MELWHYKRNDAAFGPIEVAQLISLWKRGKLTDDTPVRREGQDGWITIREASLDTGVGKIGAVDSDSAETALCVKESNSSHKPRSKGILLLLCTLTVLFLSALLVLLVLRFQMLIPEVAANGLPQPLLSTIELIRTSLGLEHKAFLVATGLATILFLLLWHAIAFYSVRRLYLDGTYDSGYIRHRPLSCFWWITPFANVVMPFLCLRELRHFSRVRRHGPQEWFSAGPLLVVLQGLVVLCAVVAVTNKYLIPRREVVITPSVIERLQNRLPQPSGPLSQIIVKKDTDGLPVLVERFETELTVTLDRGLQYGLLMVLSLTGYFALSNTVHQIRLHGRWNDPQWN